MGADIYAVAGSRFYIGGALSPKNADFVAADFASVTFVEVDGWKTMGSYGDTAAEIVSSLINRGRDLKAKGTRNAGSMENVFSVVPGDAGQTALVAAEKSKNNFAFKIEHSDAAEPVTATVTISNASPGVVTMVGHGLPANTAIVLATTGALPTGLTAGTTYYIKTVLSADTFTLSATPGGTAINTSSAGSGTHTLTTEPTGTVEYFVGLVMAAPKAGGEANTEQTMSATISINSNIVSVAGLG